jgi:hypothetical protein
MQTRATQLVVALRGRRDVDGIGLDRTQESMEVGEHAGDPEPLGQLLSHQGLTVAHCDHLAPRDPSYGKNVLIRNLSTTDYGDPDQVQVLLAGN